MNNSLNFDEEVSAGNQDERLREREAKLVRVIESLGAIQKSKEWSSLKDELFAEALESLEKKLKAESMKPEIDPPTIYRLQGQLIWAKRWDLEALGDQFRAELANIRKQLTPGGGAP